jgi:hypothetical protein
MATIQRNVKTFGTRSFVGEVSSAPSNYAPILSNEVDADLDTVYAAWNGGTDTVNLKDGSVTFAKLAPDAQLWRDTGTTITPGTNFSTRTVAVPGGTSPATVAVGSQTVKVRIQAYNTAPTLGGGVFVNRDWTTNAQDDNTKPGWAAILRADLDTFAVQRNTPGVTSPVTLLSLDNLGSLSLNGQDSNTAQLYLKGIGAAFGGIYNTYQARGTAAAPTPSLNQDTLGQVLFNGCPTSGTFAGQVQLKAIVTENWTNTARGCDCYIYTTPVGTATAASSFRFDSAGNLSISGSAGIKATGTTWANPSDRRLKDDIEDYATGLAAILQLQPRTFLYNGKGGSVAGMRGYGFIADEIAPVMPETVGVRAGKLDAADEDETDIQTLDQSNLILALVNAVKELAARVATLEGAVA